MENQDELFASLGVTAKSADQVEQQVIDQALARVENEADLKTKDLDAPLSQKSASLDAVYQEISALQASLIEQDEGIPEQGEGQPLEMAKEGEEQRVAASRRLQRAVVEDRLRELESERQRLEDAEGSAKKPKGKRKRETRVVQTLEEDNTLLEELAGRGQTVVTEKDRLIQRGLMTPFERLEGFERRVQVGLGASTSGGAGVAGDTGKSVGRSGKTLNELIASTTSKVRQIIYNRHTAAQLSKDELPLKLERDVRHLPSSFWHKGTRSAVQATKHLRRPRTLARATRRKKKLKKPKRQKDKTTAAEGAEGGAEEGEETGPEGSSGSSASDYVPSGEDGGEGGGSDSKSGDDDSSDWVSEGDDADYDDADDEIFARRMSRLEMSEPSSSDDVTFEGGLSVPGDLYERLFDYQRTGIRWLWELHTQRAGGILGDEMGLGKTIQIVAYLAALHHSGLYKPSLVVCPATVMRQWLREIRTWYPHFRAFILHDSARSPKGARPSRADIISMAAAHPAGLLLTSFDHMRICREQLLPVRWGYVVLDEGHKIRNPDAETTLACKMVQTVHRIIVSGSPIQNHLSELWSLFDFIFPGKLGTLPVFTAQFAIPIQVGGYTNASRLQVSTSHRVALVLRDLIAPYLLRRRKADVNIELPKKTEQVLFCRLTPSQRDLYRSYIYSSDVIDILEGRRNALAGIDILRKICNHPDLLERASGGELLETYGEVERSGKMVVLARVLEHWRAGGSKVLLFTQTQQMLDILERHAGKQGYRYHRMDGSTPISVRARMMDDFNSNPDVFLFLLTTRVGGLGVNLTGADRVLVYDPDWNPSTDAQARERAWRIGQTRDVTVYRLITSGTIEEKVYHRQIYKSYLTARVLTDARQRRFFASRDIADLFTLNDDEEGPSGPVSTSQGRRKGKRGGNETARIFAGVGGGVITSREALGEEELVVDQADGQPSTSAVPSGSGRQRPSPEEQRKGKGRVTSASMERQPDLNAAQNGVADMRERAAETSILRQLFDGTTGITGLADHAVLESANDPEVLSADREAAQIAERAAAALKRSREVCQTTSVSIPTWTGRHGTAGAPPPNPPRKRFGNLTNPRMQSAAAAVTVGNGSTTAVPLGQRSSLNPRQQPMTFGGHLAGTSGSVAQSSSQIIDQIRSRQAAATAAAGEASQPADRSRQTAAEIMMSSIIEFLRAHDNESQSADIVDHFADAVAAAEMPLFRQTLKQVAKLVKREGVGFWVLKPDFQ